MRFDAIINEVPAVSRIELQLDRYGVRGRIFGINGGRHRALLRSGEGVHDRASGKEKETKSEAIGYKDQICDGSMSIIQDGQHTALFVQGATLSWRAGALLSVDGCFYVSKSLN